jgi:predicted thioesterase
MLKQGLLGKEQTIVCHSNSAVAMGSGSLEVFSTPSMIALMENAAASSVRPHLEPGKTTVGISIDAKHISATPLGMAVFCESCLTEIDGKRLVFKITAFDSNGEIGSARHERMIVDAKRFMEKAASKKELSHG